MTHTDVKQTINQGDYATLCLIVTTAFNGGALQYHPLTALGVTVTMTMHRRFNRLTATMGAVSSSITVHDSDSEAAQEASIASLLRAFLY